jgi:hypothetical protein
MQQIMVEVEAELHGIENDGLTESLRMSRLDKKYPRK